MTECDLHVKSAEGTLFCIGSVSVPFDTGDCDVESLLDEWWLEWRQETDEPQTDSEFVTWLVENKECEELPVRHHQVYLEY